MLERGQFRRGKAAKETGKSEMSLRSPLPEHGHWAQPACRWQGERSEWTPLQRSDNKISILLTSRLDTRPILDFDQRCRYEKK